MCLGSTENIVELVEKLHATSVLPVGHPLFRADIEKRWLTTNENVHCSAVGFVEATFVAESVHTRPRQRSQISTMRSSRRLLMKEAMGSQFFQSRLKSSKSLAEKASKGQCRRASFLK